MFCLSDVCFGWMIKLKNPIYVGSQLCYILMVEFVAHLLYCHDIIQIGRCLRITMMLGKWTNRDSWASVWVCLRLMTHFWGSFDVHSFNWPLLLLGLSCHFTSTCCCFFCLLYSLSNFVLCCSKILLCLHSLTLCINS